MLDFFSLFYFLILYFGKSLKSGMESPYIFALFLTISHLSVLLRFFLAFSSNPTVLINFSEFKIFFISWMQYLLSVFPMIDLSFFFLVVIFCPSIPSNNTKVKIPLFILS